MSTYPGALDNLPESRQDGDRIYASHVNDLASAVNAIETELGTAPSGVSTTVRERLDTLDTTVAGKSSTGHNHAASDIASGTLATARLPFTGTPTGTLFLRDDYSWQAAPGAGGSVAGVDVIVASTDAPTAVKDVADFVCDGTADQVQINAAIDLAAALQSRNAGMPAGAAQRGRVACTGGRFNLADSVLQRTGVWLQGCGWLTEFRAVSMGTAHMIRLAAADDHLSRISDLWLNGNFASGGTGNAIDFDMTSSGNTSDYPDVNPDSDHTIHDLLLTGFSNGTRNGIYLHATGTANNRGNIVSNIQGRTFGGNGIWFDSCSDSFIANTHIGGATDAGHRIEGGNTKLSNVKSFYADAYGFFFGSGRHVVNGLEAQDNATGVHVASTDFAGAGWVIDNFSTAGLVIAASGAVINGFNVFQRSGGRYATGGLGVQFSGTRTDLSIVGRVNPANITTPISGTASSRSFVRIPNGTDITTAG